MGVEAHKVRVKSHDYVVTTFNTSKALALLPRIGELIGQPLVSMMAAQESDSTEKLAAHVASAVGVLTAKMANAHIVDLVRDILSDTHVCLQRENGVVETPVLDVFEQHFAGGKMLAELSALVQEVIRINYADFFADLLAAIGEQVPETPAGPTTG